MGNVTFDNTWAAVAVNSIGGMNTQKGITLTERWDIVCQ